MAPTELAKKLRVGAQRGSAQDQHLWGWRYSTGSDGLKGNKWMALFRKAAEEGHAAAQACLGLIYGRGDGVEQHPELMVSWYRESAKPGHTAGQCGLGDCFRLGFGMTKDTKAAVALQGGCQHGPRGRRAISRTATPARGKQDDALAVWWRAKAAGGGDDDAISLYNLGDSCMYGKNGRPKVAKCAKMFMKPTAAK